MKKSVFFILVAFILQFCSNENKSDIAVINLKCNNLENPCGTGNMPVFSWIIISENRDAAQSAYQIILDSCDNKLQSENSCLWNSGKIALSNTSWISYSGPELRSGTKYFWKVRVWDRKDNPSNFSKSAYFITGLFEKNDWKNAKWIGYEEIPDSLILVPGVHWNGNNLGNVALKRTTIPYFRKEFSIRKKISAAYIYISGLGQYELYINGKKIGNRFLSPGWTNYRKTCYYNTFDVTKELNRGPNAIGVITGNGFFNVNRERYRKLVIAYGMPRMILKLAIRYNDGSEETFISDESWKTTPSPVTFSSIYGGEDYDARLEQTGWNQTGFNDSEWKQTLLVKEPGGVLKPECDYPIRVMQTFKPVTIFNPDTNKYVYDYRQNASGVIKLKISGKEGQQVKIFPGELINDDSLVTQKATGAPYYFSYTVKGDKEELWIPRFTYYGFRYVQVEGGVPAGRPNPDNLPVISELELLHTRNSSPVIGNFKCSNELFNSIYELINWSIKSNLASVTTDCPHREKLGWLEQTHLMGNSIKYIYDIHNLYNKIIDDMMEAQLVNGLVPDIAPEYVPFVGGFRDSPEWGSSCVILPWDMYEWFGDIEAVRKAYPMMKKYIIYLDSLSEDHILSHGLGDWYDLGPKFPGEAQLTPKAVTATSIFFYDTFLLGKMASLVGKDEDAQYFRNMAEEIRKAFNSKFLNPLTKVYSTGSQTAYSMPLFFGMVDDSCHRQVVDNLIKSIRENNNALTAGDVGYRYLLRVLEQEGYSEVIFDMNSKTDVPGYGFQLSKGATSLTESWAGLVDVSNNHMMLGHLMEWFYSGLGGIRQTVYSKGYEQILINPEPVGDITWAETLYQTIHGEVFCSWKISDGNFHLQIRIPANCTATVVLPQSDPVKIWEEESPLRVSGAIKKIETSGNKILCEIPSGEYFFKVSYLK
jgi:hypothetical protein